VYSDHQMRSGEMQNWQPQWSTDVGNAVHSELLMTRFNIRIMRFTISQIS
jgi:hypothetical protein